MSLQFEQSRHWSSLITDAFMYALHLFQEVFSFIWLKVLALIVLIPMLAFDGEKHTVIVALMSLVVADFCTGLFAAYKNHQPIVSHKIYRSAVKIVVYFFLIGCARLTEQSGFNFIDLDGMVIIFLALTEMISILENTGRSGFVIPRQVLNLLLKYRDGDEIIKSHLPNSLEDNQKNNG